MCDLLYCFGRTEPSILTTSWILQRLKVDEDMSTQAHYSSLISRMYVGQ